jgi:hypothetical protein
MKKFVSPLGADSKFVHRAFANLYMIAKQQLELYALLPIALRIAIQ